MVLQLIALIADHQKVPKRPQALALLHWAETFHINPSHLGSKAPPIPLQLSCWGLTVLGPPHTWYCCDAGV